MNSFLRRTLSWPKRRWRSGGFGVHSPFAFKFIRGVICNRSEYYCYEQLRWLAKERFNDMALLFRCVCHFSPRSVAILGNADNLSLAAVRFADSRCRKEIPPLADLTLVECLPEPLDSSLIASPVVIVLDLDNPANDRIWKQLSSGSSFGMDFSDGKTGIICRLKHLPRQSFSISIPRLRKNP